MKTVAILQARMTSTRLPGKILLDLDGQPMLARQLDRLRRATRLDALVLATTVNAADDPVVALAHAQGIGCFRGDEHDVLSRYVGAAREARADVVVRITADCPLIDPVGVDAVVERLVAERADYASNVLERTFPRGLDAEAFHADVLARLDRMATSTPAREHVTWFIHSERPDLFVKASVRGAADHSDLRWTVDTPDDVALIRRIWSEADLSHRAPSFEELVAFVRARPELVAMNAHVRQKAH